ncbi:predicted protein, partial [Nematostella vectensis]
MSRFVRQSKVRHVHGDHAKNDSYDNIRVSENTWESPFCAVNPKFVAISLHVAGGGAFLVLPVTQKGRVEPDAPKVIGHKGAVLDLAWNPFDDHMIATGSEDARVMIWQIPEHGLHSNISEPLVTLEYHQNRVGIVRWHPVASNILLSSSHDLKIVIWNLETAEAFQIIENHTAIVYSVSWNRDGSLFTTTSKDKKLRLVDPRSGKIVKEVNGHEGAKPQQACWLTKFNYIFTTGFSRMSERQYAIWNAETLEQIALEEIDSSNGVQFIHFDEDTNMVYLCGKGDCLIRYYEIVEDAPYCYWISNYQAKQAQKGIGFMPKRGCNVDINEMSRIFRLIKGSCEVVSFTCPRKSELFQDDLYPDTLSDEPALTADEWLEGKNAEPNRMGLKQFFKTG